VRRCRCILLREEQIIIFFFRLELRKRVKLLPTAGLCCDNPVTRSGRLQLVEILQPKCDLTQKRLNTVDDKTRPALLHRDASAISHQRRWLIPIL
jgi:hypothetical protein